MSLDAAGQETGPAIAWFDKRTRAEVALIAARIGVDRLFAISGLAPNPIFGLCKLLWHRRHRPDAFARTAKWLNVADYLAWRLCGEMATDYSLACRTYALDISALAWSDEVLGAMEVDASLMAPLLASGRRLGTVGAAAAAATGLPRHCVVTVGGHDHVVGALAADAMRPGVLLVLHRHHGGAAHGSCRAGARSGAGARRLLAGRDRGRCAGLVRGRRPLDRGCFGGLVPPHDGGRRRLRDADRGGRGGAARQPRRRLPAAAAPGHAAAPRHLCPRRLLRAQHRHHPRLPVPGGARGHGRRHASLRARHGEARAGAAARRRSG